MSGFVALVNRRDGPVDRALAQSLTESMAYCGPDHRATWVDGSVGLGHALLAHDPSPPSDEHQPATFGEHLSIVADARLDGRAELVARLRSRGRDVSARVPDARLILHAYDEWGEACLDHLIGDFSFALWDGVARRLFCARDHFGVVPFYYAEVSDGVVLGNVLSALRRHPSISATLDERVIGDFLLFGWNMDVTSTAFADIKSLPPAQALTIDGRGLRLRRYWEPPTAHTVRLRRAGEYVERFTELFDQAIADRLRSNRIGTQLSGGMDSTSVAASAHAVLTDRGEPFDLRAYTISYAGLAPDEEPGYAAEVADRLGIPLERLSLLDYMKRPPDDGSAWSFPEPIGIASQSADYEVLRTVSTFARALLTGLGGDPLFETSPAWPRGIANWRDRISVAARAVAAGRPPRLGLRSALLRRPTGGWIEQPPDLRWVDRSFATRLDLAGRWRALGGHAHTSPFGTSSFGELMHPLWPAWFAASHPGALGTTVRILFPFFDLRLAGFVRAVPDPWRRDKTLMREAMRSRLPRSVLRRPKTPMFAASANVSADPRHRLALLPETREWRRRLLAASGICEYVDVEGALELVDSPVPGTTSHCFANCFSLVHWLHAQREGGRIDREETRDVAGLDA